MDSDADVHAWKSVISLLINPLHSAKTMFLLLLFCKFGFRPLLTTTERLKGREKSRICTFGQSFVSKRFEKQIIVRRVDVILFYPDGPS